jgi:methionine-rich copper-binding protein CopC
MKKTFLAAVVALVVTLLLGVASALPAQAHTSLKSSDPQKNAQVENLRRVTLEFSESVRFPVVVVSGADGGRYESGDPVVNGPKVVQPVTPGMPPGRYTVAWRVVSEDGHPVEGEIPFTVTGGVSVGNPTAVSATPGGGPADSGSTDSTAARGESPAPAAQPAAGQDDQPGKVPVWLYVVVFGLAGIGIGTFLSLRKKP